MRGWYSPQPKRRPKRLPRRQPIKTIPSGLRDQGIVGNWLFYYLEGGDHLHDFSPEDNHGTLKNGPVWKDGQYGWALSFDGEDDEAYRDGFTELKGEPVTVTVWFYARSLSDYGNVIHFADSFGSGREEAIVIQLRGATANDPMRWWADDGTGSLVYCNYDNYPLNEWHHLALTQDGNNLRAYMDGSEIADSPTSVSDYISISSVVLTISFDSSRASTTYQDGIITLVRIYKVVKSSSWISRRFEQTRGIFDV